MKLKLLSLILALGLALGTQVKAEEEMTAAEMDQHAKDIVVEMLMGDGYSKEDVDKALSDPTSTVGASRVCSFCKTVEGWIQDPNKNCGGKSHALTCGVYLVKSVYGYVKNNKPKACAALEPHEGAICSASSRFGNEVAKFCSWAQKCK